MCQVIRLIKTAADTVGELRRSDVYRVLSEAGEERYSLATWIEEKRPDLSAEVSGCLEDIELDF